MNNHTTNGLEIAVVGMACRVPGGNDIRSFWDTIKNGTEAISFFTNEELQEAGVDPETLRSPGYVKAGGVIRDSEWFDTYLFHYSPREAEVMDPQLKVLHECAWEALEQAGCCGEHGNGLTGVYIGGSTNLYWMNDVFQQAPDFMREANLLNGSQFFSTRLSHQLNLKGPSYTVQTACSSSLVAIHLACQGLLGGECDIALAGGVSITLPEKRGYWYQEGMILSPDGHCRPFDANAKGTVNGSGAGMVVLKRLQDAIESGDYIYAVVKGSAVNNDGRDKVSFTAPSIEGQADAIRSALLMAEVEPESITYVEAHGTGTVLGDPIEIEGLKLAFNTGKRGYCGIGSVKANIGHLDNAAGVAGFIKTALSLKHRLIPPSINFAKPNDKIDFERSPFYVNTRPAEWKHSDFPLRAGVSSFGIGGTNAHLVLEEAPDRGSPDRGRRVQLLSLSAQTMKSLDEQTRRLADYLDQNEDIDLADAAYTLLVGRKQMKHRRVLAAADAAEAKRELSSAHSAKVQTAKVSGSVKPVIFMFPGQGSQYINMGLELYREEQGFREEVDQCCHILARLRGYDMKEILYPAHIWEGTNERIHQTSYTQPAIFIFEYALARMLMNWGIRPDGMIGHSLGEYVAACLSGVLSLEHALALVSARADLMQRLPAGGMLSVMATSDRLLPLLGPGLSIAVLNGPSQCVVSGSYEELNDLEAELDREGLRHKRLQTSHAFHSSMMDPVLSAFEEKAREAVFGEPQIPYISNVTGKWITAQEAADPRYWVKHLRGTVRFSEGVGQLLADADSIFVEVGPGKTLSAFVRQQLDEEAAARNVIVNMVKSSNENVPDDEFLLRGIGRLHIHGAHIDWQSYYAGERRFRVPLPTYAFDRQYYSIRAGQAGSGADNRGTTGRVGGDAARGSNGQLAAKDGTPMTDKEHLIIEAYKEVTGVKNITLYDDFFELGGSSLSAVNVVSRLQKDLRISIRQLFEYPRASDLARHIGFKTEDSFLPKDELKRYLLARRDRYLSPADADNEWEAKRLLYEERSRGYNATSLTRRVEYKDILLTGSTGYLGIYLLYELLRHSSSNVHLIIRSGSREEAVNRIKEKLRFYFGPDFYEEWNRRIFVYNGDLTKKNLGMDDRGYRDLCGLVPCIIHSAANVSHYGKYDESYEANIVATDNLIEFALTGRIKDFNHISTMAVASGRVEHQKDILFTEFDCDVGQAMTSPYSKTKLIAEKRLMEARQKGVDVTIFRVGNIVFDSRSGKFQENIAQNALYSLIQSYVTIGLIPEMERDTDFSCVDDVSRAIVSLFDRMELKNETHHIYNPSPVSMSELLTMPGLALGVEQASIERFLDYVYDENQVRGHSSPIYNIQLHSIGDEWGELDSPADHTLFHVRSDKTAALLERTGFVWKEMNEQLAGRMVDYCRQVKFL